MISNLKASGLINQTFSQFDEPETTHRSTFPSNRVLFSVVMFHRPGLRQLTPSAKPGTDLYTPSIGGTWLRNPPPRSHHEAPHRHGIPPKKVSTISPLASSPTTICHTTPCTLAHHVDRAIESLHRSSSIIERLCWLKPLILQMLGAINPHARYEFFLHAIQNSSKTRPRKPAFHFLRTSGPVIMLLFPNTT